MNTASIERGEESGFVSGADRSVVWDRRRLAEPHAQTDKARRVRRMFDAIAPTYELINTVASAGRDRYWRREAVCLARLQEHDPVLDVGCGTGDLARAFAAARPSPRIVVGVDFSHEMLIRALSAGGSIRWCQADALRLPFADETFVVVSCAFTIRNFQDLEAGLSEMYRVMRRGGRLVILEFCLPPNRLLRAAYWMYFDGLMPLAASWLSGDRTGAYRYLPRSVLSFAECAAVARQLADVGFVQVQVRRRTCGIVAVYVASKP